MSQVWFTADLHLGHKNIIKYTERPYDSVEEMNQGLLDNWNELVSPEDYVYILGDLAMGRREETVPFFANFNGRKILFPGNHDDIWLWSDKYQKALKSSDKDELLRLHNLYTEEAGIEGVLPDGAYPLAVGGSKWFLDVMVSHFPYQQDERHGARFAEHHPKDEGLWLLHGHVHQLWKQRGRQINVGVDVWNMRPVNESEIIELIEAGEQDLG